MSQPESTRQAMCAANCKSREMETQASETPEDLE